jgi:hypothetical protein
MKYKSLVIVLAVHTLLLAQINESAGSVNPHSRALGSRIAGYAFLGEGAISLGMGLIFDATNFYEDLYGQSGNADLGRSFDRMFWIGGLVSIGASLPFLITGHVKYARFKKWEEENNISLSPGRLQFFF